MSRVTQALPKHPKVPIKTLIRDFVYDKKAHLTSHPQVFGDVKQHGFPALDEEVSTNWWCSDPSGFQKCNETCLDCLGLHSLKLTCSPLKKGRNPKAKGLSSNYIHFQVRKCLFQWGLIQVWIFQVDLEGLGFGANIYIGLEIDCEKSI